jgi:hypothetical protein
LLGAACDAHLASADRMLVQGAGDGELKRVVGDPGPEAARDLDRAELAAQA